METMIIRSLSEFMITKRQNLFLKCSQAVKNVSYTIIQLFLKGGDLDHTQLLVLKHQLFIEVLKGCTTASRVGEVSEQALLALSILPSNKWRKAVYVRSYVCGGLWSFRGTFANWARLYGSPYVSPDRLTLQNTGHESFEKDIFHQTSTNPNTNDEAPEVPDAFEEDEGDNEDGVDEKDNEDDVDIDFIVKFDSIQLQSQDDKILLQSISSYIEVDQTESDNDNSISMTFDK